MNFLARARHVRGDLQSARALYVKLIADSKQTLGPEHPTVAIRLTAYARCLLDLGNYRQAETVLREALAILEVHADGPPGRIEQAEILLAQTLLITGRLDKASELLDPGHAVGESPERLLLRARLALAHGDAAQAEQLTTALLQELRNNAGHHLPLLPEILQVQGRSLIATGRTAEAVDVLQRALTIYTDWWNEDYWRADLVRADLGVALVRNGKPAEGRSLLARSAAGLGQKLGVNHPDTRRAVLLLEDFSIQK
jgi:tetratricopeptide (TPR) repeat protein